MNFPNFEFTFETEYICEMESVKFILTVELSLTTEQGTALLLFEKKNICKSL